VNFDKVININDKEISEHSATFVIAEAGVNHGGDIEVAKQLIDVAVEAGADAVKFQAFRTEHLILKNVSKAPYQQQTTDKAESQYQMLKSLEISRENNNFLKNYCREKNIIFLTTPFDEESLTELDDLDLPAYKIASTDTTNLPFLAKVAKKGKPIFLSTGMCYLSEVSLALETIYKHNKSVVLLQCTANYPIEDSEANLSVLTTFKQHFDVLLGYSDHTVGVGAAPFAIPLGAKVVEKHFTLDKNDAGPDHAASLTPDELTEFVQLVRKVDKYLGSSIKYPSLSETKTRVSLQKSLVAKQVIKAGDLFGEDNIVAKRANGQGISPLYYQDLLGRKALIDYAIDDIIEL